MITSIQNPKIQWLRRLQRQSALRRSEHTFAVEGVRLAEEALANGWKARLVIFSEELNSRGKVVVEEYRSMGSQVELVSPDVLQAASDTKSPQGLVLALEWCNLPLPPELDFIFIPDRIRDPGNLGTMLRSAAAVGVDGVLIPPETADAFAPKTVRAGMGAHFRLPIHNLNIETIRLHLIGLKVYLASVNQGDTYTSADFRQPFALIVGSEAEGASSEISSLASTCLHIPMPGGSESLNAAIAAGILLFEAARQRSSLPRIG